MEEMKWYVKQQNSKPHLPSQTLSATSGTNHDEFIWKQHNPLKVFVIWQTFQPLKTEWKKWNEM
jgi:hypothetical protein